MKAGRFGYVAQVATTAGEVMTPPPPAVRTSDTVREAARLMHDSGLDSLPVCDEHDQLVGSITERDIVRRSTAAGHDPSRTSVSDLVSTPVPCVEVGESLEAALAYMIEHAVRRLPVVERGRLVGAVTQSALADLLPPATVRRVVAAARR